MWAFTAKVRVGAGEPMDGKSGRRERNQGHGESCQTNLTEILLKAGGRLTHQRWGMRNLVRNQTGDQKSRVGEFSLN